MLILQIFSVVETCQSGCGTVGGYKYKYKYKYKHKYKHKHKYKGRSRAGWRWAGTTVL